MRSPQRSAAWCSAGVPWASWPGRAPPQSNASAQQTWLPNTASSSGVWPWRPCCPDKTPEKCVGFITHNES